MPTQHLAGVDASVAAAQQSAEIRERAGLLEPGVGAGQHLDRLAQQQFAVRTAGDEPGGPQRHAERARGAERAGQVRSSTLSTRAASWSPSARSRQCGVRAPRQHGWAECANSRGDLTGCQEVAERFAGTLLSDTEAATRVAQHRRLVRRALQLGGQRLEGALRLVHLAPLDECRDERTGREQAPERWGRQLGALEERARIGLRSHQIAAPDEEPGPEAQRPGEDQSVRRGPRLRHLVVRSACTSSYRSAQKSARRAIGNQGPSPGSGSARGPAASARRARPAERSAGSLVDADT